MITVRKSGARGHAKFGWLDSRHTFSFGSYHDPAHMGFGPLRVINEDRVQPGQGFGTHGHRDMEIISYVIDGALEHKDSMGNGSVMRPGEIQRMTAGTGVTHSEYNPSQEEPVHFLQIWILPQAQSLAPGYEQKHYAAGEKTDTLRLVAAKDGRDGALTVHQDIDVYASLLSQGRDLVHTFADDRLGWVQIVHGAADVNGQLLEAGDGAALPDIGRLDIRATKDTEILLFDMTA
jgi:redox-sensitive bicupin YhaK (pirin superfamily)